MDSSLPSSLSLFVLLIFLAIIKESCQGPHEKRLLNHLLSTYNTLERPVANESEPLEVKFGLTLQQIIDVDEKNQILTTNAWLNLEWNDYNLRWNETEYGGVKDLRITPNKLWKPDVLMYNSADEGFDGTYHTNIVVKHNGSCLYVPPGIFKSTCKIDITWFPFDDQHCEMKFGSWTYDGNQLDLVLNSEDGGDLSDFITNGEWYLLAMPGKKNTIVYACCPEPYVDITFTIQIRRRTLYYFFNLIVPCVLISSMALLGFTLPPDSGEKLTLGVTILLSLTVFLNLVAESMPTTSDAVPLIGVTILLSLTVFLNLVAETLPQVSDAIPLLGTYFNCIMFMVASSVVLTVVVLNYHHRTADIHEMPPWIKSVFLQWLPWILRMGRPGRKITRKTILLSNRMKELELKERSSKSLLANVLDIDDDFRHTISGSQTAIGSSASFGRPTTVEEHHTAIGCNHKDLHLILKELQFITARMRKADDEAELISDWKFAAMVVDRFCLIVFTLFTIIATVTVLLSAPHIIVQ
ncbi:acetylcholine receptor subunit alpha-type acr-16 isoform X5 [Drosophila miranda]|uniref:Acetylcholine receptor subunit alpha-type acr-16 isoform X2 n=1 Tax=Drosophila pseudoobscura pseudoobscura TaxID=46245 RepID=Q29ND1_DROPS|nr:acetylcholine receptor subunit alpha-type acr-16 isoform X2 [Drosophila pseudoobscura]XP_033248977.1 acetylcholine receptor subunit alpha-type acr-16 isoform X5 [Drosophila miranda]XP_041448323.1 acetylcholine receptor subunit alpha-type acr-16 isoform X19 [Drosophila obscura]